MLYADTVTALLEARVDKSPDRIAIYALDTSGKWKGTTWKTFLETVLPLAAGFRVQGVTRGMPVGIMAKTSPTWDFVQFGALMAGGLIVGMDGHDLDENIHLIIEQTGLTTLIIQEPGLLDKLSPDIRARLETVVILDPQSQHVEGTMSLRELEELGMKEGLFLPDDRPAPSDPATIIFTSGTTGKPKGILYRHEQVTQACRSILEAFPDIDEESRLPCWLPLSNLFQRMINFCAIAIGASTHYVENPREIMKHLPAINPHVFLGVPRFFEKLHEGMMAQVQGSGPLARTLARTAIKAGEKRTSAIRKGFSPGLATSSLFSILDPLVLKKFRAAMGSNLLFMISGSAPMPPWLLERFHGMGLLILEAYGISENIVPMAMNRPKDFRFGTVGKPMNGNLIKLGEDGEVLVKGKGVFSGYFGQETEENPVGEDGYLHTGDLAVMDQDGYLTLKGRKSEVFKTSTGRKIAPVGIEDRIRKVDYVEHAVIMGAQRKSLVVLLSLSAAALAKRAAEAGLAELEIRDQVPEALHGSIGQDIQEQVHQLPPYQQPAGLLLTLEPFTIEGGELTSNLKVRRKNVQQKYQQAIDVLYRRLEESSAPGKAVVYSP